MTPGAPVENFRLQAALSYAARGWWVIPLHRPLMGSSKTRCSCKDGAACKSCGKHPDTPHGWKDGTTDPAKIRAWWARTPGANVGIVTGAVSKLVALDIDNRHGGDVTLAALEAKHGKLPPSVEAMTGSGGAHKFFRHPGNGIVIPISASAIGEGLDIRADGGLVVGVPSLHRTGNHYSWELCAEPDDIELAELPAWLLAMVVKPEPRDTRPRGAPTGTERVRLWLGKALADARPGNRNDKGHWLACQLRDANAPRGEAEAVMRDYAARVPQGDDVYTDREAIATLEGVMRTPARPPAASAAPYVPPPPRGTRAAAVPGPPSPAAPPELVADAGAGDELHSYLRGVMDGTVFNVPFPWDMMTSITQALLPGSFCVAGGDPGVGKTFMILQCLRYWHANGIRPAVFFLEKNRRFHTMRLLAQLEADGNFVDHDWIKANPAKVGEAMERHKKYIDDIGSCIWSKPRGAVTIDVMTGWLRDRAKEGRRVIIIDPITALDAGADRWTKDDDFVRTANDIISDHGVSLMSTTHPKQTAGGKGGTTSGHSAAGGAAYFRFTDTMFWMTRAKKPRRVEVRTPFGTAYERTCHFWQLFKTRDGKGASMEVAYRFGQKLSFEEIGIVTKDVQDNSGSDYLKGSAPALTVDVFSEEDL